MSRECATSATVRFEGIADGDGGDASGNSGLLFTIDNENREELARKGEEERGEAAMNRISSCSSITMLRPKKTKESMSYGEQAVICTVIVVIWGLLTLPTIYFHMPQVRYRVTYIIISNLQVSYSYLKCKIK